MKTEEKRRGSPDKTAAVCGLYCQACTICIATAEDPERLKRLAGLFQVTEDDIRCCGCRSDKRTPMCEQCRMYNCAKGRGIEFCSECADYPCEALTQFQSARPHRRELWNDLEYIKSHGCEAWLELVRKRYACPKCRCINSAYDLQCRNCGEEPSCAYVAEHGEAIRKYLATR